MFVIARSPEGDAAISLLKTEIASSLSLLAMTKSAFL